MATADYFMLTSCSHFRIPAPILCHDGFHHGLFSCSALQLRVANHVCHLQQSIVHTFQLAFCNLLCVLEIDTAEAIVHTSDRVGGLTVLAYVRSHREPSTEMASTKWLLWSGLGIGPTKNTYLSPYDRQANRTNELPERTIPEDPPPQPPLRRSPRLHDFPSFPSTTSRPLRTIAPL